jgi:hypothetical protein
MGIEGYNKIEDLLSKILTVLQPRRFTTKTITATGTGTIDAGWNKISIYNSGGASGTMTVSGSSAMTVSSGETHILGSEANGVSRNDVSYDATGTTFKIIVSII